MRWLMLAASAALLSGCTPQIINDTRTHLLLSVDGMNDGIMEKANIMAEARCRQYGMDAGPPTVHETGFVFPKTWYIEYDCTKPPTDVGPPGPPH